MACRCGHSEEIPGPHPYHGESYTCRKPAKEYFYDARLVALSGMQMKAQVSQTFACDDCWDKFQKDIAEFRAKLKEKK